MTAETPYVTPDYALRDTIIVLVGVVVGGMDRLWTAALGGFAIGFASQALAGFLPSTGSWPFTSGVYLDSAVFGLVILTLLLRPDGLFTRRQAPRGGARMKRARPARRPRRADRARRLLGMFLSNARAIEFENALVFAAIVVALYVFIGNSGVISFGQIGFFLVGAYAAGELSIPPDTKSSILPNVFGADRRPLGRELLVARDRRRWPAGSSRSSSGSR